MKTTHPIRVMAGLLALLLPLAAHAGDVGAAPIAKTEGGSYVVPLATGLYHSCALKPDGRVDCWGDNTFGRATDQDGPFVAVSTGGYHSCGLKSDGRVDCWGASGIAADQDGPFVAISAGYRHTCGLKADGAVACWGWNDYGQATVPTGAGPFMAISAGEFHTCGLLASGAALCWGAGSPEDESGFNAGQAIVPDDLGPLVAISAGGRHTCGLNALGRVRCWGDDSEGQSAPQVDDFVALSAGGFHTCGVKTDGSVHCWGVASEFSDDHGQAADQAGPFVAVSASFFHTCGLTADGQAVCWGAGGPGEPGDNHNHDRGQSTVPDDLGPLGFGQIAAGNAHACELLPDGELDCWGANDEGQAAAPFPPIEGTWFTQVVAGDSHACAIDSQSKVTCWGRNDAAIMQDPMIVDGVWRQLAPGPDGALCALSADYQGHRCVRESGNTTSYGSLYGFRNITHGLDTHGLDSHGTDWEGRPGLCAVSLAMAGNGYCNSMGSGFDDAHQGQFAGPWQRLESGLGHQCGLKADGTLACWGDDADGQTTGVPTDRFRAFSVGWNHACAIKDTGTLACWGSNLNGQTDAPAGAYVQVAAGNTFTCAIRDDGKRVCWGASPGNPARLSDLPDGTVHVAYSQQIAIVGPNAPADPVFVHMSGPLPDGLSLTDDGLLDGMPIKAGTFTFTVDAEGDGTFAASRTYTVSFIDPTAPEIGYTLSPLQPDGDNGWYVSDVGIDWTVSDPESEIVSSTGCEDDPARLTTDTTGDTFICTATSAGGEARLETAPIKRDATPPTIIATETSAPDGNDGWYRSDVTVTFACADALSGVDENACPVPQTLSAEGGAVGSTAQTASDRAGNTSAPSNTVTVKLDKTAPTLAPTVPSPLLRGGNYSASPNASDATSGVASSSCGALDTSSTGGKSTSCTATDNAGNVNTVTLNYTVTTTCANDGYKSTQLTWCQNICENGLTGQALDTWIHRWIGRYRDLPYCRVELQQPQ